MARPRHHPLAQKAIEAVVIGAAGSFPPAPRVTILSLTHRPRGVVLRPRAPRFHPPMMPPQVACASSRRWLLCLLAVLAVVAAVYAPTVDDYFGGDDFMVLGPVRAMGPWELIWKAFLFRDGIPYWRPLVSPLYAAEVHLFWLRPWPYHVVVIGLHLVNVALLAAVARALTGRRWLALAAALIFGIHPAKTTTVPMVSSTVELFAMVWYLLAVLCCVRYVRGGAGATLPVDRERSADASTGSVATSTDGLGEARWYWLGLGAFVLGLLSKESVATAAVAVSALFFFLGFVPERRAGVGRALTRLALRALPFWLLVLPYAALTYRTERADDPTGIVEAMYFVGPHIARNLWWFLARLAVPADVANGPTVSDGGHVGAALLMVLGLLALARGSNATRFLVVWTLVALTPLALWRPEYLVGRFTYMATAPYAILLALAGAWAAARLAGLLPARLPRRAPALGLLVVATVLAAPLTIAQNRERTREGQTYRVLVQYLRRSYPDLPEGSEVVLENGVWRGPFHAVFLNSVADTLYGPGQVRIVNVEKVEQAQQSLAQRRHRPRAVELRYEEGTLAPEGDGKSSD